MALEIAPEDPGAADIVALLGAHLAVMRATSPAGHVHALDLDALRQASITFFCAREDHELLGVGAVRDLGHGHGEVKSMHTTTAARGKGVGRHMLGHIIKVANERGWQRLSLETGTMHEFNPARALYESTGFEVCEPFGTYTVNEFSICMTLEL